ncbi:MAG: phage tail protein [bacterium]
MAKIIPIILGGIQIITGTLMLLSGNPWGLMLMFTGAMSISTALARIPRARTPKRPDEVFSFMGAEARSEPGMPVGTHWGRNLVGGQLLQLSRDFERPGHTFEVLTMVIGIGEGKAEGFSGSLNEALNRIFVNDQSLKSLGIDSRIQFTDGTQDSPLDKVFADRLVTHYRQSTSLDDSEFSYTVQNKFAEGVEVGITFPEGLYGIDMTGDNAGSIRGAKVEFTMEFRDVTDPDNLGVWQSGLRNRTREQELLVINEFPGVGKVTDEISFTMPDEGGHFALDKIEFGAQFVDECLVNIIPDTGITFTNACTTFTFSIDGETGARTEDLTYQKSQNRIKRVCGTVTYTTSGNSYAVDISVTWSFRCIADINGIAMLLTGATLPDITELELTKNGQRTGVVLNVVESEGITSLSPAIKFRDQDRLGFYVIKGTWSGAQYVTLRGERVSKKDSTFQVIGGKWAQKTLNKDYEIFFPDNVSGAEKTHQIRISKKNFPGDSDTQQFNKATIVYVEEFEFGRLRYPNTALLALQFFPSSRLSGGTPQIKIVWDGQHVYTLMESGGTPTMKGFYDWANPSSDRRVWGRNPACILYTIYRDIIGVSASRLDLTSFKDVRDRAFANGITFDYSVATEVSFRDFIEDFKNATGFVPIRGNNGVIELTYDKAMFGETDTSAFSFNEKNIIDKPSLSLEWGGKPATKLPNAIEIQYRNAENNYAPETILLTREDLRDFEKLETVNVLLNGVTIREQALKKGNVILNTLRLEDITARWKTGTYGMHLQPTDIVDITHEDPGWSSKQFKITKLSRTLDEPNVMTLEAIEFNPDIYKRDGTPSYTPDKLTFRPPNAAPLNVLNLNVTLNKVEERLVLFITFDLPDDNNFSHAEIYLSEENNDTPILKGNSTGQFTIYHELIEKQLYTVSVTSVSIYNIRSFKSAESTIYIDPFIHVVPPNVEDFTASFDGNIIHFEWSAIADTDLDYYEIREGQSWEGGTTVATRIRQTTWSLMNIPEPGTYKYFIKAIDKFRDESEGATDFILEIPPDKNRRLIFSRDERVEDWIFESSTTSANSGDIREVFLGSDASGEDDFYNDMLVEVENVGWGHIEDYVGSTKLATLMAVDKFSSPPKSGKTYKIRNTGNRLFRTVEGTLMLASRKRWDDMRIFNP